MKTTCYLLFQFLFQAGETPLHEAAKAGDKVMLELLLHNGADLSAINMVRALAANQFLTTH